MLNNQQVIFLADIADLSIHRVDGVPVAIGVNTNHDDKVHSVEYKYFREQMGLEDLRFHWLLGEKNYIAGGSVLNWIWQENTQEDTDFFFEDKDSADTFAYFLESIGLKETKNSGYARTFFSQENGAIIQVVGGRDSGERSPMGNMYTPAPPGFPKPLDLNYGTTPDILGRFDIELCKFATDADYVYFTSNSVSDLIRLEIETTESMKEESAVYRLTKYIRKGFYTSTQVERELKYNVSRSEW